MKKRSVKITGHATSITLEEEFWQALKTIATERGQSLNAIISEIDRTRTDVQNLSSAIRIYILKYYQDSWVEQLIRRQHIIETNLNILKALQTFVIALILKLFLNLW